MPGECYLPECIVPTEPDLIAPTSVPDLTNALVAEWKQVPTAMFQHLVDSLLRRVEAVIAGSSLISVPMILE
jgi:hypothetical protein